jgi:methylenetetrahydrofolate dehydrogenase (NADP+)/methenyltetrahydrofolate cyclohydrolase
MEELNSDEEISGILLFRPLPKHIDEEVIRSAISPDKDVDCMHPLNLEKIFEGNMTGFAPCTPKAAMEILIYNDIQLEGSKVAVVNRSMVVGKPLVMMLLEKNATVTICHSRTKELSEITKDADIVVTALGKPKFFGEEFFNPDSIVIDVGVGMTEDGKLSGDVDYENVSEKVSMITPVPGGVGSVTTTILLNQVVLAAEK